DQLIDGHRRHRLAERRSVDRERSMAAPAFADRSSIELVSLLRDRELTPAAAAIRNELQRRFREALDTLAEDDREILLMRHVEHLSNREAAQSLGRSEAAAGMRHRRALRRLRAVLGEDATSGGGP